MFREFDLPSVWWLSWKPVSAGAFERRIASVASSRLLWLEHLDGGQSHNRADLRADLMDFDPKGA